MDSQFQKLFEDAVQLLHELCTPNGILASSIEADNYKRIWARDSIVCGLAGIFIDDDTIIEGLKNSLITLADHQHELGMIPSNVSPGNTDVSFGSLVGRVDTTTWFIVGCCKYYKHTNDHETWNYLKPKIEKCRSYLKSIEFNNKGWIYTPLSGNWADEYPIHGYTLYDNMLRIWGELMWCKTEGIETTEIDFISEKTRFNFWPSEINNPDIIYQKGPYETAKNAQPNHFAAFILPGDYDLRFDAAANALALFHFSINETEKKRLTEFIDSLTSEISASLIPAFWPIITDKSDDWNLLKGNYSYDFKNHAGDFHNGGIWPVWMGMFCLGLSKNEMAEKAEQIIEAFTSLVSENKEWDFQEYINSNTLKLGGKNKMGYTASGVVFMHLALQN
ncbi:MAG: hypothetical protein HKN48_08765 [Flavobacteriaceae bacterium]|nr:hypothetical protein [Flavobacteriaceae bacterium]